MPTGINFARVPTGWRNLNSVRAIECRLATDLCLEDFPGYVPKGLLGSYRTKSPLPAALDSDPIPETSPPLRSPKGRVRNRRGNNNRGDFRRGVGSRFESPPARLSKVETYPNSDGYPNASDSGSGRSGRASFRRLGSTALALAVGISGVDASEVDSKSKFVYSESCRARDWPSVPVKIMQRELPQFN